MSASYDERYGYADTKWWEFGARRDLRALAATTTPPSDLRELRRWKRDRQRKEYLLFPQRYSLGDSFGVMWRQCKDENNALGVSAMTPDDIPPRNSVPGCPAETSHTAGLLARAAHDARLIGVLQRAAARGEAERDAERRTALAGEARLAELLDGYTELLRAFTSSRLCTGDPQLWSARISDAKYRRLARLVVELEPDNEEAA